MKIHNCRSCRSPLLHVILDLGEHPVSNSLLSSRNQQANELRFPLQLAICEECLLLQLTETVPAKILYQKDYPYFSSASPALLKHARQLAESIIEQRHLGGASFVVEVASNDGYLLRNFTERGVPCLGIDPAIGPASVARKAGIHVINDFFSLRLADILARQGKQADVIFANNVIAHVDGINDLVAGLERLLKPGGVAIIEFAYAIDMIEKCEFDTIYHEHIFYHTLHGLTPLLKRHGLSLVDAMHLPIHGGSLRVFVAREGEPSPALLRMIDREQMMGADKLGWYAHFSDRVTNLRKSLIGVLDSEKRLRPRIVCYGAAAKGATLLNYLNLGPDFFEYAVDASPHKQGKFMPGQYIPIVHPGRLLETLPDLVLMLAWNFAGEILYQQAAYRAAGGRFLVPVPTPLFIEPRTPIADTDFAVQVTHSEKLLVDSTV